MNMKGRFFLRIGRLKPTKEPAKLTGRDEVSASEEEINRASENFLAA